MSAVVRHRLEDSPVQLLWQKLENAVEWAEKLAQTPQGPTWQRRCYTLRVLLRNKGEEVS
jgi:HPt (histidine-containing phosphotransfer) domain-containing protein